MKKIAMITILSLSVAVAASAQKSTKKGPSYKNAHPSEKYSGNSAILIEEDPGSIQGPAYKNFKRTGVKQVDSSDIYVSTSPNTYVKDKKAVKTYRKVELKDATNKNKKGLKGPAYKNYRPGQK